MQKSSHLTSNNFSEKYNLYGKMLFRLCMVYLGNKEDTEEAMQESFFKLIYNSPKFTDGNHEKAWLIRVTINICKDMLRSVWHKRVVKMEDIEVYYNDPSNIGKQDIYTVNGYDKNFRIMTYIKIDGVIESQFFECSNGITVKSGADIFDKLKIEKNIKTSKYENYESWNNSKQQYFKLTNIQLLNNFVEELKNTTPYTQESLSYLFNDNGETNQKFIYVFLNDGSQVELRLFKDGYIYYASSHIFFKMENPLFNKLWNELA